MTRRFSALIWVGAAASWGCLVLALEQPPAQPKPPKLGEQLSTLPAGPGSEVAEAACLRCHSADMLIQQRLTPKQWTATIDKMMKWGAEVPEDKKQQLLDYLSKKFDSANTAFKPTVAAAVDEQ